MADLTIFMEERPIVEGEWEKTEKGWSHRPQQLKWSQIIKWQEEMFLRSCYLYYVKDKPKLSDDDFDCIVRILEVHFDELDERIRNLCPDGKLKPVAYMMPSIMTEQEIKAALEWGKI